MKRLDTRATAPPTLVLLLCAAALFWAACRAEDGADTATRGADTTRQPAAATTPPNTATPAPPQTGDGVRRVTVTELQGLLARGEAVTIDVRGEADYRQGHIKGALLIPGNAVDKHVGELPRDKLIVTYCA